MSEYTRAQVWRWKFKCHMDKYVCWWIIPLTICCILLT